MKLNNKTAIITGSNSGIGLACIELFAENGCNIIACCRSEKKEFSELISNLSKEYNIKILPLYFNLENPDEIKANLKIIFDYKINIDILVNNAGYIYTGLAGMTSEEELKKLFQINFYAAENLKSILTNPKITKIFHYARFDIVILKKHLQVKINPIFCTKIASKLVRTYTSNHGLKDVTKELLGIDLSKQQQSSDWANQKLSSEQLIYAANDVLNLHLIHEKLSQMLNRENRMALANSCFEFLETRGDLDALGWGDTDIFDHK